MTEKLWDDALKEASVERIIELAAKVPKALISASIGIEGSTARDSGLLLTKGQVLSLTRYETLALRLPYTLQSVMDYLRFGAGGDDGGAGLRAKDFLDTFLETRLHATKWSDLRSKIMLTSIHLKSFGLSMENYGDKMIELESELKASGVLREHDIKTLADLERLKLKLGDRFPDLALGSDTVVDLKYVLGQIDKKIKNNLINVSLIKAELDDFSRGLRLLVLPGIKNRLSLIATNPYPKEIADLNAAITQRAELISEKNTQYKLLVQKSLGSAATLNIFGLGMSIYYGVEAEAVRKERNALNAEQDRAIATLRNKNQTLGSLKRVEQDLQNLDIVTTDANVATNNLRYTWDVLRIYVSNSSEAADEITDALRFRQFILHFQEVVNPWKEIVRDAGQLSRIFDEADEEYVKDFVVEHGMRSEFVAGMQGYPSLDLALMSQSYTAMSVDLIKAKTLFNKLQYLPALKYSVERLVRNIDGCDGKLKSLALVSKNELENSIRKLEIIEEELALEREAGNDAGLVDELLSERRMLLEKIVVKFSEKKTDIGNSLQEISAAINKAESLGYVTGLEADAQIANEMIERLNITLVRYRGERKIIVDAIEALEKSGVESIGREVALTLDKLVALGMKPTELELVKFAIEQLKRSIGDIAAGIRLIDMIRESDKLHENIDTVSRRIKFEGGKVSAANEKIRYIQTIHLIEDQRKIYVAEYNNAVQAFQRFAQAVDAGHFADDGEHSIGFRGEAQKFITFLQPVSLP